MFLGKLGQMNLRCASIKVILSSNRQAEYAFVKLDCVVFCDSLALALNGSIVDGSNIEVFVIRRTNSVLPEWQLNYCFGNPQASGFPSGASRVCDTAKSSQLCKKKPYRSVGEIRRNSVEIDW